MRQAITRPRLIAVNRTPVAVSTLKTGLTDYWRLEEASGNRVGVNGTVLAPTNAPGNATGKLGKAAQFVSASAQRLTLSSAAAFEPGNSPFTVGGWVWFDTFTGIDQSLMAKYTGANATSSWLLYRQNSNQKFNLVLKSAIDNTLSTFVSEPTYLASATSQWYFVVAGWDGSNAFIQVNNQTTRTAAFTAGVFNGGFHLNLGTWNDSSSPLNGRLDGCFYYSRALTLSERALLWNNGNGLEYPFGRGQLTATTPRSAS